MATGDGPDEPDLEDDDPDFSPNSLSESEGNAWPELDELEPDNHQEDWLEQEAWGVPDVEEGGMDAASGPRTRAQASQMGHSMVGALGQSLHEEPGAETGWQDEPAALPPFMINLHNAADLVEWYKFKKELWQDLEQGTAECKGNGNLARPQGTKRRRKEECKRPEDRSMSHHHLSVLSSQMNAHAQLLMQVHAAASSLEGYEQVAERTNSLLMDLSGTSKSRLNSLRHRASPLAPFYPAHVAVRDAWKGYSKVHKELDGNVLGPSSFHCCQLRTPLEVPALMRIDDFLVRFSDLRGRGMIPVKGEKETSEGDHCYDSVPSCVHEGPLHLLESSEVASPLLKVVPSKATQRKGFLLSEDCLLGIGIRHYGESAGLLQRTVMPAKSERDIKLRKRNLSAESRRKHNNPIREAIREKKGK